MQLWRISNYADLSGEGGRRASGRWHDLGTPVVYLSENAALAMMEVIVHLEVDIEDLPNSYQLLCVEVPSTAAIEQATVADLDKRSIGWRSDQAITREHSRAWFADRRSALLRVPSVILPHSWNFILNPLHPDAKSISIISVEKADYDRRLFESAK